MNRRFLLISLAASSMCGGTAFAQSSDIRQNEQNIEAAERQRAMRRAEERRQLQNQRADERRRAAEEARQYRGRPGDPSWNRRDDRRDDGRRRDGGAQWRHDGRGAGPDHAWYRGSRLPPQYRSRQYVVDDWRGHRLSAPPRGYHWVQAGNDYVLVAIATGIIASILLSQ